VHLLAHQIPEADLSEQGVSMSIQGADGTMPAQPGATGFRGYIPSPQDYFVTVTAESAPATYTLQLFVPLRMAFARGGSSGTVQGVLAQQALKVQTSTSQGEVILIMFGVDGNVLISDHAGATSFTGKLPTTEDYLIDVESVGSRPAGYRVTVTIPPK
jgi:hypothetical protein